MTGPRKLSRIEVFPTLDSTSLEAKRRAALGEAGPLWIIALKQTAGYGRRGSEWLQEEGDIAATFLFRAQAPAERLPQLSFVAALALTEAIARFAPRAPLALKWPNDVLANGAKLAGLLLELVDAGPLVALGAGVNIVSAPKGVAYPTARLIDFMREPPPAPRAFVEALDETFEFRRRQWANEGFAPIRADWLDRAAGRGQRLRVNTPAGAVEGVFEDLDLSGALILNSDGERRAVAAGAVAPPPARSH
ncbi:MAG TPA: biotin--[acetyl-CoA-carboxylase] ligase [Parvularcula sp.]|nr:biotin--[acetyl-CoA-carboxylase] ligase [Parvularcula sp.]HBS32403.1 biotin--[acetyl-CoA-carboxylase] ligase [Parvularcula sp.]HBS33927.1 biotin--[acetyl-CoA-carboxylase] ligase [Parvularcula sp.]